MAAENISSLPLISPVHVQREWQRPVPKQPVSMVLLNYEKQIGRREDLTDRSIIGNQGIMLPVVQPGEFWTDGGEWFLNLKVTQGVLIQCE